MIDGPLKADGRLAAKNATKIRAALTQVTNFKSVFDRYQETQPQPSKNRTQDRARARAWILLNVGFNNEALHNAIMHAWAEAYVLGETAANVWIIQTRGVMKAPITGGVNWDTWKPGDKATALLVKPVGGFKRYLEQSGGASYFKKFDKETTEMLGTALADAIAAGLDSEAAALLMKDYVGSAGRALTIAITEQNRAMSFSTIQRYKEADLEKMEWHVSDPCDICKQNAGVVINIGSTFPSGDTQPPAHPHCRCVLLPIVPGMEEDTGVDGTITSPTMSPDGTLETPTDENYRGFHRAPTRADEFGSPATDVREMMPDFYEKPHIYTTGMDTADKESLRVLQRIKDKPEEMVTIYRAVPHGVNQINPGDWVTLSPSYAETHLAGNVQGGGHVISMQIRAKDLWFDGDSINEFGYDPVKITSPTSTLSLESEVLQRATIGKKIDITDFLTGPRSYEGDLAKMGEVIYEQGWNKPALAVKPNEYEALKASGKFVEVFRGGPKGLTDGLVSGKPWIGDGNAGPGTYVTVDKSRAESFATLSKMQTGESEVVTALIPREMIETAPNITSSPANPLPSKWSGKGRADYVANAAEGKGAYESSHESSAKGDYVIYNTHAMVIRGEE